MPAGEMVMKTAVPGTLGSLCLGERLSGHCQYKKIFIWRLFLEFSINCFLPFLMLSLMHRIELLKIS